MSVVVERVEPMAALARVQAELIALQSADMTALSDEQVLDYGRQLERSRRLIPSLEHRFILELEAGELPGSQCLGTSVLLRGLLRLDPREAGARVRAAHAAGSRRAVSGQPLPPMFAEVAARAGRRGDLRTARADHRGDHRRAARCGARRARRADRG